MAQEGDTTTYVYITTRRDPCKKVCYMNQLDLRSCGTDKGPLGLPCYAGPAKVVPHSPLTQAPPWAGACAYVVASSQCVFVLLLRRIPVVGDREQRQ